MNKKESNKRKGDILEYLIAILEKSNCNNPTTKIFPKYIIKDRDGIDRELDLYFEVSVNGKLLRYAFECKNYKKGVSMQYITDFYAKIEGLGIPGFFVTTSNYQSGAISKAKALNIQLLKLKKRDANSSDLKGIFLFRKNIGIDSVSVSGKLPDAETNANNIFSSCPNCKAAFKKLVDNEVVPHLLNHLDAGVETLHPEFEDYNKIAKTFGKHNAKELSFFVLFDAATITHKGSVIGIDMVQVNIKVWNEIYKDIPLNMKTFSYCQVDNEDEGISFSYNEFVLEDKNIMVSLTKHMDGRLVASVGTIDDIKAVEVHPLHILGTIDQLGFKKDNGNITIADEECTS